MDGRDGESAPDREEHESQREKAEGNLHRIGAKLKLKSKIAGNNRKGKTREGGHSERWSDLFSGGLCKHRCITMRNCSLGKESALRESSVTGTFSCSC